MNAAENFIAIDDRGQDYELNKNACGRIVWWALSGEAAVQTLGDALRAQDAGVAPPEAPTELVALHRAADDAARKNEAVCRSLGRGAWAITTKAQEETTDAGAERLVSDIRSRVWLSDNDTVEVRGDFEEDVREFYDRARRYLSQAAISQWLCKTITALGAVALRESGGFYFVPKDAVDKWLRVVAGVEASTGHHLFNVPALRSADALNAILAAVTSDTTKACAELSQDLSTMGKRALETRERGLQDLVDRTGRYEAILGKKLDALRDAMNETRGAITAAMFALVQDVGRA